MAGARVLTTTEIGKRVRLLDALYLSADRWLRAAREATDPRERGAAYRKYEVAWREYVRVRDTPFAIADE